MVKYRGVEMANRYETIRLKWSCLFQLLQGLWDCNNIIHPIRSDDFLPLCYTHSELFTPSGYYIYSFIKIDRFDDGA